MSDDDGGPPPLEDMSAVVAARAELRTSYDRNAQEAKAKAEKRKEQQRMFGGLQGGFFNNNNNNNNNQKKKKKQQNKSKPPPRKQQQNQANDTSTTPLIRKSDGQDGLLLPEVQAAMSASAPSSSAAAAMLGGVNPMDPEFLKAIASDPVLLKGMQNPKVLSAMNEIARDPQAAVTTFSDDPELAEFIAAWIRIAVKRAPQAAEAKKDFTGRQVSEDRLREWMSDPVLRDVLNNPQTSAMLAEVRANPSAFEKYRAHPHMQILIKAGILQM